VRRISKKREQLNAALRKWRKQFREQVGRCEMCLKKAQWFHLDVHELVPGYCRAQALDKPYACLCLHRRCHMVMEMLTIPQQMAYLLKNAPERFDLDAYHKLIQRRWPYIEEIQSFKEKISHAVEHQHGSS